jgi:hypothetical protein
LKLATYKLLKPAVIDGIALGTGILIGDGTPYPFSGSPTADMELITGDVNFDPTTKGPKVDDRGDTDI